jgi:hypothetical protein
MVSSEGSCSAYYLYGEHWKDILLLKYDSEIPTSLIIVRLPRHPSVEGFLAMEAGARR